jgi:hypothetical protein
MKSPSLEQLKVAFNHIGWFVPPYVQLGFLWSFKGEIDTTQPFDHKKVESIMARIYQPIALASMVCDKYPITPFVQEYQEIIAESVEAYFSGLGHVAFLGLIPVVEGAGRKLAQSRSLPFESRVTVRSVFAALTNDCKQEAIQQNLGATHELVTMLDSFSVFIETYFYANSSTYPLSDNSTRHGPVHGVFTDGDYGHPINFFKAISAIDVLCLIAAFRARVSWLAPDVNERSARLAIYYSACRELAQRRPT